MTEGHPTLYAGINIERWSEMESGGGGGFGHRCGIQKLPLSPLWGFKPQFFPQTAVLLTPERDTLLVEIPLSQQLVKLRQGSHVNKTETSQ